MGNIVICTKRTYEIQMPNGTKIEVESEKPLSGATTAKLLEDDSDIGSFLENIKILDIKGPKVKESVQKRHYKKRPKKKLKKEKMALSKKIGRGKLDLVPKEQEMGSESVQEKSKSHGGLTPCERINMMITMDGEFTRLDYQKFMEDKGHRMSNFMGYGDIEDAIMLKRIAPTGEKIGKGRKKYRIIDVVPVEQYLYKKVRSNKEKRRY